MVGNQERPLGFAVKIFIPMGEPDGVKVVEKSNWNGSGLVIPRSLFGETRTRPELQRAGVYILAGPSEDSFLERVYVGEGDPIGPRLDLHVKNKDFWTRAVGFTSKDQNLNKAHVQYLESRLVELAKQAKRCTLDNGNTPLPPSLSEADTAEAEGFLADVLLCLPILGYHYFEAPPEKPRTTLEFLLKSRGVTFARGFEAATGFIVRKGSFAAINEAPSIHTYLSNLRQSLITQDVMKIREKRYEMTQDYTFSSPSTAAGVLLGRSANGRLEWKTTDGRTLKSIQEAEVGE